jgi:hypothetical protein
MDIIELRTSGGGDKGREKKRKRLSITMNLPKEFVIGHHFGCIHHWEKKSHK